MGKFYILVKHFIYNILNKFPTTTWGNMLPSFVEKRDQDFLHVLQGTPLQCYVDTFQRKISYNDEKMQCLLYLG